MRSILTNILLTSLVLLFANFALAELAVTLSPDNIGVQPGERRNLIAQFHNQSSEAISVEPQIVLPKGWRVIIPIGKIELATDESIALPFTVQIPETSTAKQYRIDIYLEGNLDSVASAIVEVTEVEDIQIEITSKPNFVSEDHYQIKAVIINKGNTEKNLFITARDNYNYLLNLTDTKLTLAPSESSEITIDISTPEIKTPQFTKTGVHQLTIIAEDDNAKQLATATTKVKLVAQILSNDARWHHFPLMIETSSDLEAADNQSSTNRLRYLVSGNGKLFDNSADELRFRLTGSVNILNILDIELQPFISYKNADYKLSGGHFSDNLASLLSTQTAWGLSFEKDLALSDNTHLAAKAHLNTNEVAFGISTKSSSLTNYNFRAALVHTFEGNGKIGTALNYSNTLNHTPKQLQPNQTDETKHSYSIRANYFVDYKLASNASLANKVQLAGRWKTEAIQLGAGFDLKQKGYDNASEDVVSYSADLSYKESNFSIGLSAIAATKAADSTTTFAIHLRNVIANSSWSANANARFLDDFSFQGYSANFRLKSRIYIGDSRLQIGQNLSYSTLKDNPTFRYQANLYLPLDKDNIHMSFDGSYHVDTQQFESLTYSLGYTHYMNYTQWLSGSSFGIDASYSPLKDSWLNIGARATLPLPDQSKVFLQAAGSFFGQEPQLQAAISYQIPLDVPISLRNNVGQISGKLLNSKGEAVAGKIIEIAGTHVLTKADGSFEFPSIPEGTNYLSIPSDQLPITHTTLPATPLEIEVENQITSEVEIYVVEKTKLNVNTIFTNTSNSVEGRQNFQDTSALLKSISVTLNNDTGDFRRGFTNSQGEYKFNDLTPGNWSVQINHGLDSNKFKVIASNKTFSLDEGEVQTLTISIEAIVRNIQFSEGGVVKSKN